MNQPDANPLDVFDTQASTVECDLSNDDMIALCGNTAWRIVWFERAGASGWRIKAVRVTSSPASEPEQRMPYRDD
jgi:hypothetical protein